MEAGSGVAIRSRGLRCLDGQAAPAPEFGNVLVEGGAADAEQPAMAATLFSGRVSRALA